MRGLVIKRKREMIEIPASDPRVESPTYRHPLAASGFPVSRKSDGHSFYDWMMDSFREWPDSPFTGTRERLPDGSFGAYHFHTYSEVDQVTHHLASGLRVLSLPSPPPIPFICIWSKNREEWTWVDLACVRQTITVISIFDAASDEMAQHILHQTAITTVFCGPEKVIRVAKLKAKCPQLRTIVHFDPISEDIRTQCAELDINLVSFQSVLTTGRESLIPDRPPTGSDFYAFSYTSGTTGLPKGVMSTYFSVEALITSIFLNKTSMQHSTRHLSYMPLAHLFERVNVLLILKSGAVVGFYSGDVMKIIEDAKVLGPAVFPTVPRMIKKIVADVQADIERLPWFYRIPVKAFLWWKRKCMDWFNTSESLLDSVFLRKYRHLLGTNLRTVICSSAPIDPGTLDYLALIFSVTIIQAYGQTETGPISGFSTTGHSPSSVGFPYPCTELKLVSLPDMDYYVTDCDSQGHPTPRGEILARGPCLFSGYYQMTAETEETIDGNGWVHTGDVGEMTKNGLKIIDRKKHFFKLSQGEYIAPEKIQNILLNHELIMQIFVTGDSNRDFLVAILYPSYPHLLEKYPTMTPKQIARNSDTEKYILDIFRIYGREKGLNSLEIPKRVYLKSKPMKDVFTPSMKLMRAAAQRKYAHKVEQLYSP